MDVSALTTLATYSELSGSTCLVTGAAGFVGSNLVDRLLEQRCHVLALDCFTDYYSRALKAANVRRMVDHPRCQLVEADLAIAELAPLLDGVDYVFHQAGQAGVRASWGDSFASYTHCNVLATQRLLEAAREARLRRFIYASSSSIYGNTPDLPMRETSLPRPTSPYGVTKLAAEHLCGLYHDNFGVPTVSLRYFTVYGPRQRPDMAFHKFIRWALAGQAITLFGDGSQSRDVTYVGDVVDANVLAATHGQSGRVYNIGGGSRITIADVIALLEDILGCPVRVDRQPVQAGDVAHTEADCSAARAIGFAPRVGVAEGLRAEANWLKEGVLV
ncbi:MAG: NAD-dependent epimerase/dehydratase family protein [Chloroflexota bacterium]